MILQTAGSSRIIFMPNKQDERIKRGSLKIPTQIVKRSRKLKSQVIMETVNINGSV
jgi:hypothetical protein